MNRFAAGLTALLAAAACAGALAQQNPPIVFAEPHIVVPNDPAAKAAIACGEPPLQVILARQGYTIDEQNGEVTAQRFVKAGPGPVIYMPVAAYGLADVSMGGWYTAPSPALSPANEPKRQTLWQIAPYNNKQPYPPVMKGSTEQFDPGKMPFGLWVSSTGFNHEYVYSEDALQVFIHRFGTDLHKAHIYAAVHDGHVIPHTYLVGWEYSTNNDDQDMVTLVSNVIPKSDTK
jgi:hypothetical protein